jgi:hypothetical protein
MALVIACPVRLQGVINGQFFFDALVCPGGGMITAHDVRDHTLGVDCNNIIDPLSVATLLVNEAIRGARVRGAGVRGAGVRGDVDPAPFGCGCANTGLRSYATLKSSIMLAPGFDIIAEDVVQYVDKNDDGHYVERLAHLFTLKAPKRKPILIGQELAPGTRVSGALEGELKQPFGHYHPVITKKGLAHITTKSYLQPVPAQTPGNGASRGRGARAKGKKRGGK